MRQPLSIIGLFCEDIRAELQGTDTIVGILPDNINVPEFPFAFPKLALYIRILFDAELGIQPGDIVLRIPGIREDWPIAEITETLIAQARENHQTTGAPIAGIICRTTLAPFPVPEAGRLLVVARVDKQERICGSLYIQKTPEANVAKVP